jgi:hypothetical protein
METPLIERMLAKRAAATNAGDQGTIESSRIADRNTVASPPFSSCYLLTSIAVFARQNSQFV